MPSLPKPYTVTINVKEKADEDFVYSFNAEKESSTRRTLHAAVNTYKGANGELFIDDMIPQESSSVKENTFDTQNQARRILLPDGSEFEFIDSKKRNAELTSGEERINSDTKRTPIGSTFSRYTIPQEYSSVKENISDTQNQARRRKNANYLDVESSFGVAYSALKYADTLEDTAIENRNQLRNKKQSRSFLRLY